MPCEALFEVHEHSRPVGACVCVCDLPLTWGPGELDTTKFVRVRLPGSAADYVWLTEEFEDKSDPTGRVDMSKKAPDGTPLPPVIEYRRYRRRYRLSRSRIPAVARGRMQRRKGVLRVGIDATDAQFLRALRYLKNEAEHAEGRGRKLRRTA